MRPLLSLGPVCVVGHRLNNDTKGAHNKKRCRQSEERDGGQPRPPPGRPSNGKSKGASCLTEVREDPGGTKVYRGRPGRPLRWRRSFRLCGSLLQRCTGRCTKLEAATYSLTFIVIHYSYLCAVCSLCVCMCVCVCVYACACPLRVSSEVDGPYGPYLPCPLRCRLMRKA